MNKYLHILILLLFSVSTYADKYYISSSTGSTSGAGTIGDPYYRYSDISSVGSGDTVFFMCGDTWDSTNIYLNGLTGTNLRSYGSGAKPIITSWRILGTPSDNGDDTWTYTNTDLEDRRYNYTRIGPGVWYRKPNYLNRLMINGIPQEISHYPNDNNTFLDISNVGDGPEYNDWFDDDDISWTSGQITGASAIIFVEHWLADEAEVLNVLGNRVWLNSADLRSTDGDLYNDTSVYNSLKYYFINHLIFLTNDGDWVWDRDNQQITVEYSGDLSAQTVKQAFGDSTLCINNCTDIEVVGLEFQGGVNYIARINSSTGRVDSCNFRYSSGNSIFTNGLGDFSFSYDTITDGTDVGLWMYGSIGDITFEHNYVGKFMYTRGQGGDEHISGVGVYNGQRYGKVKARYNHLDSVAWCGFLFYNYPHSEAATDTLLVQYNLMQNACMLFTDGGGLYIGTEEGSSPKLIKNNIVTDIWENHGPNYKADNISNGLYQDYHTANVTFGYNFVTDAQNGIYFNGGGYATVEYNKANRIYDDGITLKYSGYDPLDCKYIDIYNNVTVGSETGSHGFAYYVTGSFLTTGSDVDNNYWYNPFDDSDGTTVQYWAMTERSITSFNTFTGSYEWMENGTYNYNGQTKSDAPSIADSLMTLSMWNWSPDEDTVNLHGCVYMDYLGNEFYNYVTVPAYSGYPIWYVSGDSAQYIREGNIASSYTYGGDTGQEDTCDAHIIVYDTITSVDSVLWGFENTLTATYGSETSSIGTATYDNTAYRVGEGTYSLRMDGGEAPLITSSIELGDSSTITFYYFSYWSTYSGDVIAGNKSFGTTTSGWLLRRAADHALTFETWNGSGTANHSTSKGSLISTSTLYKIVLIVNKTEGYCSFIVDGTYATGADSTINTDFATPERPIYFGADASSAYDSWIWIDSLKITYYGQTITETDSCVQYAGFSVSDTLHSYQITSGSCSIADVESFENCVRAGSANCSDSLVTLWQGDYIGWNEVDFGAGVNKLSIGYHMPTEGEQIEVRLDDPETGSVIKTISSPGADPCIFTTVTIPFTNGTHDIYVINKSAAETAEVGWIYLFEAAEDIDISWSSKNWNFGTWTITTKE